MSAVVVLPADLPRDTLLLSPRKWRAIRSHLTGEQEQQQERHLEEKQELRRRAVSASLRCSWPSGAQVSAMLCLAFSASGPESSHYSSYRSR